MNVTLRRKQPVLQQESKLVDCGRILHYTIKLDERSSDHLVTINRLLVVSLLEGGDQLCQNK